MCILAIYVDDTLIFVKDLKIWKWFITEIKKTFEITDKGNFEWCLQMEVKRDRKSHTLTIS